MAGKRYSHLSLIDLVLCMYAAIKLPVIIKEPKIVIHFPLSAQNQPLFSQNQSFNIY